MAGYLTTHVLDTARGRPAAGIDIVLARIEARGAVEIACATTNADGRTDTPILPAEAFTPGVYELCFHTGPYLARATGAAPFYDTVPVRFSMDEAAHYHVPLLLSPYGYSTYRGS